MFSSMTRLDRWIGISGSCEAERALLRERRTALKRQLPWLYGILFVNLLGLYAGVADQVELIRTPATAFLAIIAARLIYWMQLHPQEESLDAIRRDLRSVFCFSLIFSAAFCIWAIVVFWGGGAPHQTDIIMFATLAAIGTSYALAVFPAAARLPLLVLGLPLALTLAVAGRVTYAGMGLSLVILILLTLRLVRAQEAAFSRLVYSRFAIEAEKRKAEKAQRIALTEQSRVNVIANSDPLTNLANRRGFLSSIEHLTSKTRRQLALIVIDLDGFKPINDTFGHACGDALLIEVSRRLQLLSLKRGLVARLGGDEFAVVCQCRNSGEAVQLALAAITRLQAPYSIDGRTLTVSACAGLSYQNGDDLVEAMRRADVALYRSKRSGRGQVALFSSEMEKELQRRTSIEQALLKPGLEERIDVAFQPIFCLRTMELRSFEALARWRHSVLGWVPPSEFIPITERLNVVERMTIALLHRAAQVAQGWPEHVKLSFNLSAVQLCSSGSADEILAVLRERGLPPGRLQIEVTETALLADFDLARLNLTKLRAQGVSIVLDDFGAGYSSIGYLREMNFEAVKLDGSLIISASQDKSCIPLLRGVLSLCEAISLPCVAEHIENEQQLSLISRLGCAFGQGNFLAPPLNGREAVILARAAAKMERPSAAA